MNPPPERTRLQDRFGGRATGRRTDAKSTGFGRLVIAVYGVFSLSAGVRSLYQLATEFSQAPLAIALSTLSAMIYVVATVAMTRTGARWHGVARAAVGTELLGVLAVGALSVAAPELFPKASVWSHFGAGYGYVPLVLPVIGLIWLRTTRPSRRNG